MRYFTDDRGRTFDDFSGGNGVDTISYKRRTAGVKVLALKYRETGYDCNFAGSWRCDDPFFNALRANPAVLGKEWEAFR